MSGSDQRRFPRVEFFLVPDEHEQLPVWVIKPAGLAHERGGVVVNLSGSGLQILAASEPALDASHYELRLLLGEDEGVPLFSADVRRVWNRPLSPNVQIGGFEFDEPNSQAEEFLHAQTAQITARKWVRCVLVERVPALN
ncbi:PilZ domain-containing protein [Roseateles cellulosilyticus]|uniref:PilZ domain-containing protein n=1 Tax=Pelomonas cellulosilytica TaxID=2906762 RepID=A0ABS8XXL4_9BURK|nr:PilZ domain-containing protein [Pelomonas sp. P8]MCE4556703.1 PilZ domain-containing protein [Pelomonas sp. P8]